MQYAYTQEGDKIEPFAGGRAFCSGCGGVMIAKCGPLKEDHWAHESLVDCDSWKHEPITQWHLDWQNCFTLEEREVVFKKNGECHRADIHTNKGVTIEFQNSMISMVDIREREKFYPNLIWVINAEEFKHRLDFERFSLEKLKIRGNFIVHHNTDEMDYMVRVPRTDVWGGVERALKNNDFKFFQDKHGLVGYNQKQQGKSILPPNVYHAFINYFLSLQLIQTVNNSNKYDTNFTWKSFRKPWMEAKYRFLDLNNGFMFYIKTMDDKGNGFGCFISKEHFLSKYC